MQKNIWWIGLLIIGIADWWSTALLIERYGPRIESNLLAVSLYSVTGIWGLLVLKLLSTTVSIWILWSVLKGPSRSNRCMARGALVFIYALSLWVGKRHVEWWAYSPGS